MSETNGKYIVSKNVARDLENMSMIGELLSLMSKSQIYLLIDLLDKIRDQGHGEVKIRVSGDHMYITEGKSHDAGIMPARVPKTAR